MKSPDLASQPISQSPTVGETASTRHKHTLRHTGLTCGGDGGGGGVVLATVEGRRGKAGLGQKGAGVRVPRGRGLTHGGGD